MTDLTALKAALEAATQGEWEWWNGSSWWRLGVNDRNRSRVIEPYTASDGYPDLIVSPEDRAYIVATQPRVMREIIAEMERLRGAVSIAEAAFHDYMRLHLAKGTPDGDTKAKRNAELAGVMTAALAGDRHD